MRAGECPVVKSGSAIWGKSKTPARVFLRANCFDDQGMSQGGQVCQQQILRGLSVRSGVASVGWILVKVASLASAGWILDKNSKIHPESRYLIRNPLYYNNIIQSLCKGGFQVDSPVKKPVASKMPRSAPSYTDRTREEPWRGGVDHERSARPKPAVVQDLEMLLCGPSNLPFAASANLESGWNGDWHQEIGSSLLSAQDEPMLGEWSMSYKVQPLGHGLVFVGSSCTQFA